MKTKFLLALIVFVFTNITFSQNMTWQNGQVTSPAVQSTKKLPTVQYGAFSSFSIDGINLFLYRVTISGSKIDMGTPVPTELQTLFRLSSKQLNSSTSNDAVTDAVNNAEVQAKIISDTHDKIADYNKNAKAFNTSKKSKQAAKKLQTPLEDALGVLKTKTDTYVIAAKGVSLHLQNFKLARVKLINLAQTDVDCAQMTAAISSVTSSIPGDPTADYQTMLNAYIAVQIAADQVKALDTDEEHTQEIETALNTLKNTSKTIDNENPITLFSDVNFLVTELQNKKNFIAIAPPVQADGDFIHYKVTVTPTQTNTLGANKSPKDFEFDIPVKGGWKADFSVGPTFSFGKNSKDEKYFLEPSTTSGSVILRQRNNNNALSPGIAAMMHFYTRKGYDFNWGGMFGVGAGFQGTEDADVSFYGGISFILGKAQKIMINSGLSFLKVDRLKTEQYKVGNEYLATDINLSDVTEKVLKGSFFLSVSYNLSNRTER